MEYDVLKDLQEAEMVLVGLGSEFDNEKKLRNNEIFIRGKEYLENAECLDLLPLWMEFCSEKSGQSVSKAIEKLTDLLEGKNCYVISTSTHSRIAKTDWRTAKIVMPCGSSAQKQCKSCCDDTVEVITERDIDELKAFYEKLYNNDEKLSIPDIGICSKCGGKLVLNTVYTDKYNEGGYLADWNHYLKWLQGTLNRKLLILELGVGMDYPSIIRWPFEKVAFYNNKAKFYRVNEKLYQLTEELSSKGRGISNNAIEWIQNL